MSRDLKGTSPLKMAVYFPADDAEEIHAEAKRLGRTVSWLIRKSWIIARPRFAAMTVDVPTKEATP